MWGASTTTTNIQDAIDLIEKTSLRVVLLKGSNMHTVIKALMKNGFGLPAYIQELKLYDYQEDFPLRMVEKEAQEK